MTSTRRGVAPAPLLFKMGIDFKLPRFFSFVSYRNANDTEGPCARRRVSDDLINTCGGALQAAGTDGEEGQRVPSVIRIWLGVQMWTEQREEFPLNEPVIVKSFMWSKLPLKWLIELIGGYIYTLFIFEMYYPGAPCGTCSCTLKSNTRQLSFMWPVIHNVILCAFSDRAIEHDYKVNRGYYALPNTILNTSTQPTLIVQPHT